LAQQANITQNQTNAPVRQPVAHLEVHGIVVLRENEVGAYFALQVYEGKNGRQEKATKPTRQLY
jgi:hypothetical protein